MPHLSEQTFYPRGMGACPHQHHCLLMFPNVPTYLSGRLVDLAYRHFLASLIKDYRQPILG